MYSILSNDELDESLEQTSLNELQLKDERPKEVYYNSQIPIEFFDFIIFVECHRAI
jgi:type I restriction enzyme, R subunit